MRRIVLWSLLCLCSATAVFAAPEKGEGDSKDIRIAIFNFECVEGVDAKPQALTDHVTTVLSTMENVQLVDREQLAKVAEEQKIALSGIDAASAAKVGRFVSAQYVLVGRASKIGQTNYLVVKVIDTETTKQTTVAAKAPVEDGVNKLLGNLETPLTEKVGKLRGNKDDDGAARLEELKKRFKPLAGKTFLVEVSEEHVNRPLRDPAAQMAIAKHMRDLGMTVIVPEKPVVGWKEHLLETGKYGDKEVDYLVAGEGVSANAGQIQGLVTCRARVELRIVPVPGREVAASDSGAAAAVDLVEALGAKSALEEAGVQSADATLTQLLKGKDDKKKSRKDD